MKTAAMAPEARAKWIAALIIDTITAGVIRQGERAGRDYVSALANDYGSADLAYRSEPWDADARRLKQHRLAGVSDDYAETFYDAFALAASDMAGGYRLAAEYSHEAQGEARRAEDR